MGSSYSSVGVEDTGNALCGAPYLLWKGDRWTADDTAPFYASKFPFNPRDAKSVEIVKTEGVNCAGFASLVFRTNGMPTWLLDTEYPGSVFDKAELKKYGFRLLSWSEKRHMYVDRETRIPLPHETLVCAPYTDETHQGHVAFISKVHKEGPQMLWHARPHPGCPDSEGAVVLETCKSDRELQSLHRWKFTHYMPPDKWRSPRTWAI